MTEDSDFRVRPGKAKRSKAQGRNARGLVAEVLRVAAIHSGGRRAGASGARRGAQSTFGRGRTAFARSRLFGSGRRVMVKMLPVTTRSRSGRRSAPLSAHVAYLKREGVTRDGDRERHRERDSDGCRKGWRKSTAGDDTAARHHHASAIYTARDGIDVGVSGEQSRVRTGSPDEA